MPEKIILAFLYALFNAAGASLIKSQIAGQKFETAFDYIKAFLNYKVIGGFGIIFLSVLAMFKLLTLAKLSFVVPVSTAMNFVITLVFATVFFNEKPTWTTIVALALILSGIILHSTNKTQ
jgi:drug/metabolite transporter (DMT)-like permease